MRKLMDLSISVFVLALLYSTAAAPAPFHPDRVISLPGAPLLPEFNLFSGHLNGSSNGTSVPIFYLLAEAIRVDPSTAPLVIWFNGGPGGSSLYAFFKEHGPYRITESGDVLTYHEFSWNQYANVLYFESPLGVGFSQNAERDLTMNDIDAANMNFYALKDLMTRVHPNYANLDYYLSGQSYAGAYVPYFSRRLLEGIQSGEMENGRFKGFAIGNPIFDQTIRDLDTITQFLSYGLIPLSETENILEYWKKHTSGEEFTDNEIYEMQMLGRSVVASSFVLNSPVNYNYAEHCYNQTYSHDVYHVPTEKQSISCFANDVLTDFLNRIDVQTALHVGNVSVGTVNWQSVNLYIADGFKRENNILHVYDDIFRLLNGSSFRVLVYQGDTDVMVPTLHTLDATNRIAKRNSMEDQEFDSAWRFYGDFGGIRKGYRNGNATMDVITVRGSGHSVPTDLPAQAFQMINNFLFTGENKSIDYSVPIQKH